MDRRAFIATAANFLAAPLAVDAQPAGKVVRIGVLSVTPAPGPRPWVAAFRAGLQELGYIEGHNLILDWAEGELKQLPTIASQLVSRRVDLIYVPGSLQAGHAGKQANAAIPIVVGQVGAPVECGLVASLARPGGNITGGAWVELGLIGKLLELLKDVRPTLSRIGMLWNPDNCADAGQLSELQAAGRAGKVQVLPFEARTGDDVKKAFPLLARGRVHGLTARGGHPFSRERGPLAELAPRQRLPLLSVLREFADRGALATYGPNYTAANRRAAILVDKILKGARPADLPMERPTK